MPFGSFNFDNVWEALNLTLAEADLYSAIPPVELSAEFLERLRDEIDLGVAINTEKARSEYIIAPLLGELRRRLRKRFSLFSGVEFNVDPSRGLTGFCDFILSRSPVQMRLTVPVVAIVEAKNDNVATGLGQCIAAMVAARDFNATTVPPVPAIFGATTTGTAWRFMRLIGSAVTVDLREYQSTEPGRIIAILTHILTIAMATPSVEPPSENP